ncbi:hypothetical protein KSX_50170 [Ktedonospora formicarum]|uniref:Uncharacterized protein n=1 Tax=Ktedonospora formicarum TaxID=2778364 RepID=A0A8J3I8Y5_9CHLR|nr:hypothetical protein KSX_50170 [Ktedonospora formicarum]
MSGPITNFRNQTSPATKASHATNVTAMKHLLRQISILDEGSADIEVKAHFLKDIEKESCLVLLYAAR